MSKPRTWVVGAGGFLGRHAMAALSEELPGVSFHPQPAFPWRHPAALKDRVRKEVEAFSKSGTGADPWAVLWCAGRAVVGASAEALEAESATFSDFLDALAHHLADAAPERRGVVVLASSAGGIYGGSRDAPITEASLPRPLSAYGLSKLAMEARLRSWAFPRKQVSWVAARITNLYGPGQRLDKPQGVVSQIARSVVLRHPVHLYVPLDTRRDYLFVRDGARLLARCARRALDLAGRTETIKILASERPVSLSEILGVFSRITRKRPRFVASPRAVAAEQPAHQVFRSEVWREEPPATTDLVEGVQAVYLDILARLKRGDLAAR